LPKIWNLSPGLSNWLRGDPDDYDRGWAVDLVQLRAFIAATQPTIVAALDPDGDSPTRQKSLVRLQGEIAKRGVIDILRNGPKHGLHDIALFYPSPRPATQSGRAFRSETVLRDSAAAPQ
jgi:type I restriction enzyme R subunit